MSNRTALRRRGAWRNLPAAIWRQWRAERALARRGISFRNTNPRALRAAYGRMRADEFAAINARQTWANWRTIPALVRRIPLPGPWKVLDLGSGQGDSTEVLAWCCPRGSDFLGYDLAPAALRHAAGRRYRHASGGLAKVRFRRQSIDQRWRDVDGSPIEDASVTLVNASGIFGHHVDHRCMARIAAEIARVLSPGGWALLDLGPTIDRRRLTEMLYGLALFPAAYQRSCWLDPFGQLAFRKAGSSTAIDRSESELAAQRATQRRSRAVYLPT
jgi:SAM-dependent methyltransferase